MRRFTFLLECIGATSDCKGALTSLVSAACQTCLEASCCAEVGACHSKDACWHDCLVNHSETACHADPGGHALGTCWQSSCAASARPPPSISRATTCPPLPRARGAASRSAPQTSAIR